MALCDCSQCIGVPADCQLTVANYSSMYVCMYVCIYVCVYVYMSVFICACVYVCMYVCMYVCNVYVFVCASMYVCMCAYRAYVCDVAFRSIGYVQTWITT